jgi:hypothetical protein
VSLAPPNGAETGSEGTTSYAHIHLLTSGLCPTIVSLKIKADLSLKRGIDDHRPFLTRISVGGWSPSECLPQIDNREGGV